MTRDNKTNLAKERILESGGFAIGPLDGRYKQTGEMLSPYFSEYALVKNRVMVEVNWLIFLLEENVIDKKYDSAKMLDEIEKIYEDFSAESYLRVKEIEKVTNHDVKSVELYVAEKLKEMNLEKLVSFVHIGCTSEDITNVAYANMLTGALEKVWIPKAIELLNALERIAKEHKGTAMLAHTHGQPATPTTVGKEFAVYVHRLKKSLQNVTCQNGQICAKFNGATGNYAALSVAFPGEDWPLLSKRFIEDYLRFKFNPVTTQIESHDYMCHLFDSIRHFNNVLLDLDLDMWLYISMEYFKQIPVKNEVGSSTMPHKVNPIRFENSEANSKMSNTILMELSNQLPRSRMQRDLSDSSSQRNIGLAIGYSLQAIEQTIGGLKKVAVNEEKISADLENKWEVLAEPIQTMLRKYGVPEAYNQLKELTRGKNISKEAIREFIESLDVLSEEDKNTLLELTPVTYIGYAAKIVDEEI